MSFQRATLKRPSAPKQPVLTQQERIQQVTQNTCLLDATSLQDVIAGSEGIIDADAIARCNGWLQARLGTVMYELADVVLRGTNKTDVFERDIEMAFRVMGKQPVAAAATQLSRMAALDPWFNVPKRLALRKALSACFAPVSTSAFAIPFRAGYDDEEDEINFNNDKDRDYDDDDDGDDGDDMPPSRPYKLNKLAGHRKINIQAFITCHDLFSGAFARPLVLAIQQHLAAATTTSERRFTDADAKALLAKL
jgi:hypothetical protein